MHVHPYMGAVRKTRLVGSNQKRDPGRAIVSIWTRWYKRSIVHEEIGRSAGDTLMLLVKSTWAMRGVMLSLGGLSSTRMVAPPHISGAVAGLKVKPVLGWGIAEGYFVDHTARTLRNCNAKERFKGFSASFVEEM